MPRWAEALDTQLDTWRWFREELGARELRGFAESFMEKAIDPEQHGLGPEELQAAIHSANWKQASALGKAIEAIPRMLWQADPIYVDHEMMPLVDAAVGSWKAEPLIETDILIPTGFLLLPRPVYVTDIHQKSMSVRAFLWHPSVIINEVTEEETSGIVLCLFSNMDDPDDYQPDEEIIRYLRHMRTTKLALCHIVGWPYGENTHQKGGANNGVEIVQCILRLMAQTIAVRSEAHAPRAIRKRIERANFPTKRITVVTLRRPEGERDPDAHRDVAWTRRWIVDGHWRNQWHPSLGIHRQIWISPYVKGPTDLPLVVPKAHVYQFVR